MVELSIYLLKGGDYSKFSVIFAQNEDFHSKITYNRNKNEIEFDRTFSGIRRDVVTKRKFKLTEPKEELNLRLILDKFSVEAFINDGSQTMTSAIYTPIEANGIIFESDGVAEIEIESHKIKINNFEEENE